MPLALTLTDATVHPSTLHDSFSTGQAVMSKQPTWFYNTKAFWIGYPHWQMRLDLKAYYLLQFAYWLQQLLVLVLKIEKPRSDYMELCCHVSVLPSGQQPPGRGHAADFSLRLVVMISTS